MKQNKFKTKTTQNKHIRETKEIYLPNHNAKPFLKWAGGKNQLIKQFKKFFRNDFNKYIEPFVGGGAVFFHLYNEGKLHNKEVILLDSNKDLINCYKAIKENVNKLLSYLSNGKYKNNENTYYKIREEEPRKSIEKAARTIYLNKTCYNGLYRVNLKGKFNVPFGRYKNPLICDLNNLKAVSRALQNVKIIHGDFKLCLKYANKGDFVYLDPPYHPISKTSNFTNYTSNAFNESDQRRLAGVLKELDKRKCRVMLSNSDNNFIKNLYNGFGKVIVKARRAINCMGTKRGYINELIIYNHLGGI